MRAIIISIANVRLKNGLSQEILISMMLNNQNHAATINRIHDTKARQSDLINIDFFETLISYHLLKINHSSQIYNMSINPHTITSANHSLIHNDQIIRPIITKSTKLRIPHKMVVVRNSLLLILFPQPLSINLTHTSIVFKMFSRSYQWKIKYNT